MRLERRFEIAVDGSAEKRSAEGTTGPLVSPSVAKALRLLLRAHLYACELNRSPWDFAVEIEVLYRAGLFNNDLRWLTCRGYVEHARETTVSQEGTRRFRCRGGLVFGQRTCFILTEAGIQFARQVLNDAGQRVHVRVAGGNGVAAIRGKLQPKWDRDRQELRLGAAVVKQFKVLAVNQERILAAFEEEGWPVRIDDPLPPQVDQDPKRRLHDTINGLNRKQLHRLIRFSGDGTGQGIRWSVVLAKRNGNGSNGAHA